MLLDRLENVLGCSAAYFEVDKFHSMFILKIGLEIEKKGVRGWFLTFSFFASVGLLFENGHTDTSGTDLAQLILFVNIGEIVFELSEVLPFLVSIP